MVMQANKCVMRKFPFCWSKNCTNRYTPYSKLILVTWFLFFVLIKRDDVVRLTYLIAYGETKIRNLQPSTQLSF